MYWKILEEKLNEFEHHIIPYIYPEVQVVRYISS